MPMKLESFSPQAELLKEQQVEKRNLAAENEPGARIVLGEGQAFLENEKIVGLESPEAKQFDKWIEKIGNDPDVPERYRFIHKLCRIGFYDKNRKYI